MIKKLLFSLAVLSLVAGTSLSADPIGLSVGIDSFDFGDVAKDDYKFSGEGGSGAIAPFVAFDKAIDQLALHVELYYKWNFTDPTSSALKPKLKVGYSVTPELNVYVAEKIVISELDGKWNYKDGNDESTLQNIAELGIRYTLGLDFGDLYFQAEPGVYTQGKGLLIGAIADNDGFQIGVNKVAGGLYGFVRPYFQFYESYDGEKTEDLDILYQLDVRVGYEMGPLNARVTVGIPTGSDKDRGGIAENGLSITPRVTYKIMEGLSAWAQVKLGGIAGDEDKGAPDHLTVSPSINVTYAF